MGQAPDGVELPEVTGKALSQLMTFLTEVEMIATDTPAMWLPRLNPDFIEVRSFIAAQAMDEARHAEGLPQARPPPDGASCKRAPSTRWR